MEWVLERLPILIFVLVFLVQIVRAVMKSRGSSAPREEPQEVDEEQRVREIQEQIRRRIAERRGGQPATAEPPPFERGGHAPPPILRRQETTQLPDPFGGPLRRVLEEFERETHPPARPVTAPPVLAERRNAELERQERLAGDMRTLEEARALAKRRAVKVAAVKQAEAQSTKGLRSAARGRVLEDLKDSESLRRAFVLREVLGPPVGLR